MDYDPKRNGLAALLIGPEMRKLVNARARIAAAAARSLAPVDTGALRSSIYVDEAGLGGPKMDRACAKVVADIEYGAVTEFGALDNSPGPRRFLRRGLDATAGET